MKNYNFSDIAFVNKIISENQLQIPLDTPDKWHQNKKGEQFDIIWNKSQDRRIIGIRIHGHKIKHLTFPTDNKIIYLECGNNGLCEIDLSQLKDLHFLSLSNNSLSQISLNNNPRLKTITLNQNKFS